MRGRRPPKRRCPVCGGDHYAWQESQPCPRCKGGVRADRRALADMLAERREARREAAAIICRHPGNAVTERPQHAADDPPGHYLCRRCGSTFPLIGDTDMWAPVALESKGG